MGDVIDLTKILEAKRQAHGNVEWMACSCSGHETAGFAPLCGFNNDGPYIIALVCLGCEHEIPIAHGVPQ
jgi:hypothetical protein